MASSPSEPDPDSNPGARLERALELFLNSGSGTPADADALANEHPELRELFASMGTGGAGGDGAEVAGEQVLGDYRLIRELGRGGMGIVYEAWQRSLDRRVAVKVLSPALVASPSAVARFRREAAAAGRMRHPNLVEVYGFGSEAGQHFFAMQVVDGESLHACAERFRDPAAVVALGIQLLDALGHAHAHGLVHRDVKPANILVRTDGSPMLTDFGVASDEALPSLTRDGGFVGTLDYASPEQVRGEAVDARTDLWSAGVVLRQLLVGVHPFAGATQQSTFQNILTSEPPSLLGKAAVSRDLAAVIGRALTKDRSHRYASAAAMLADLRAVQAGTPVSARLPTIGERLVRWVRREPWQAAALLILAGGLAAAGSLYLLADRRADENATLAAAEAETRKALGLKVRDYDQLAGVVLCDQAVAHEATIHPAWPRNEAALANWLQADCARLEQLRPAIERTVSSLRDRAKVDPVANAAVETALAKRQQLSTQLADLDLEIAIRRGDVALHEPAVPGPQQALELAALNQFAWCRVAPKADERTVKDEAALGLACARLAAERAVGNPTEYEILDTLAWALAANGQDVAALAASDAALSKAPPAKIRDFETYREFLEGALVDRGRRRSALLVDMEAQTALAAAQRVFSFDDESVQFLHDTLTNLLGRLDRLVAVQKVRVEARLAWARRIAELTEHHPDAPATWAAARAAIAAADDVVASKLYRGREITLAPDDVVGLVPIGMNPVTKLWEFYDLRSASDGKGDPAALRIPRHAPDGSVRVEEGTGIVFVLLPGGNVPIGSQSKDPDGANYDPDAQSFTTPVREVALWPFFIARHEMTQGQWSRLYVGDERLRYPSGYPVGTKDPMYGAVTLCYPVERVSWNAAVELLGQHGLDLPTEAQWEYACRAGTWTPFWSGPDNRSLAGAANVYDQAAARDSNYSATPDPFDDGHTIDAPVGSFRANPFGLFDMHGNVGEWCRDTPSPNYFGFRPGDGARPVGDHPSDRSQRSGSYKLEAHRGRSSLWTFGPAEGRAVDLGLRAVRLLRRP